MSCNSCNCCSRSQNTVMMVLLWLTTIAAVVLFVLFYCKGCDKSCEETRIEVECVEKSIVIPPAPEPTPEPTPAPNPGGSIGGGWQSTQRTNYIIENQRLKEKSKRDDAYIVQLHGQLNEAYEELNEKSRKNIAR